MALQPATGFISAPAERLSSVISQTAGYAEFNPVAEHKVFHFEFSDLQATSEKQTLETIIESRPMVVISTDQGGSNQLEDRGTGGYISASGTVEVAIEKEITDFLTQMGIEDAPTSQELIRLWANFIGPWLKEIFLTAKTSGELDIAKIYAINFGRNAAKERTGKSEYLGCEFRVDWGIG